jgi:hypothetical protein
MMVGLSVSIGGFNILGADYNFIEPYEGDPPWNGPGREFLLQVSYHL